MLRLASLALSILALAQKVAASSGPLVLDSYATQLLYLPDSSNITKQPSWNASFTGISWSTRQEDGRFKRIASGQGYHWANGSAATTADVSVSYTFYGTGVEFFGYFGYLGDQGSMGNSSGSLAISIREGPDHPDDIVSTGSFVGAPGLPGSLGKFSQLTLGKYTVTMRPTSGIISFTHLSVDMEFSGR